jgi:hypothetical protein
MQVYGPRLCEDCNPLQQEHIVIIEPAVLNLKLFHKDDEALDMKRGNTSDLKLHLASITDCTLMDCTSAS